VPEPAIACPPVNPAAKNPSGPPGPAALTPARISQQPLELRILGFQFLQPARLRDRHPGVLRLPVVERRILGFQLRRAGAFKRWNDAVAA